MPGRARRCRQGARRGVRDGQGAVGRARVCRRRAVVVLVLVRAPVVRAQCVGRERVVMFQRSEHDGVGDERVGVLVTVRGAVVRLEVSARSARWVRTGPEQAVSATSGGGSREWSKDAGGDGLECVGEECVGVFATVERPGRVEGVGDMGPRCSRRGREEDEDRRLVGTVVWCRPEQAVAGSSVSAGGAAVTI